MNVNLGKSRLSQEELIQLKEEAKVIKRKKIAEAIKSGIPIHYTNTSISLEERETLINISEMDNAALIDSTIQKDITKCLNRNWEITSITYRKNGTDENDNLIGIIGMSFKSPANKISILSC